jgi:hypothetical protein
MRRALCNAKQARAMNHPRRLFRRPGFAGFLLGAGLLAFDFPLLDIPARAGGALLWLYLFLGWSALIAGLVLLAGSTSGREPGAGSANRAKDDS